MANVKFKGIITKNSYKKLKAGLAERLKRRSREPVSERMRRFESCTQRFYNKKCKKNKSTINFYRAENFK